MTKIRLAVVLLIAASLLLNSCGIIIINHKEEPEETEEYVSGESREENDTDTKETNEPLQTIQRLDTADAESLAKKSLDSLPVKNFDGIAVIFACVDDSFFLPEDTEIPSTVTKLLRNRNIEERFNTKLISHDTASSQVLLNELKEAKNAGDYYADVISYPASDIGSYCSSGLIMNMNTLPFTDYSAPYYNKDAIKQMSAGNYTFAVAGDFTEDFRNLTCLFFNRSLCSGKVDEEPYMLADTGELTWDKVLGITTQVCSENDSINGIMSSFDSNMFCDIVFLSSGSHYMNVGTNKIPKLGYNTKNAQKAAEAFYSLVNDKKCGYIYNANSSGLFYNDGAVCMIGTISDMSSFTNMKSDWGILPVPKVSETQSSYHSYMNVSTPVISVPSGSSEIDRIGLLLQALNASSYECVTDSWYTYYMNNVVRDNNTMNMIDIIRTSRRYDFALMFGSAYNTVPAATYQLFKNCALNNRKIADYYESNAALVNNQMSKTFEAYNK